jgi:hypothetical protein
MGITFTFKENKYKLLTFYLNTSFNQNDNSISSFSLNYKNYVTHSLIIDYHKPILDSSLAKLNLLCTDLLILMVITSNMSVLPIQKATLLAQSHIYKVQVLRCAYSTKKVNLLKSLFILAHRYKVY